MQLPAMQVVAKHDAPVRHCFFVKQLGAGMLVTGGWDKTVGLTSTVSGPRQSPYSHAHQAQHRPPHGRELVVFVCSIGVL